MTVQENVETAEDKILHFPDGLPGFPELERFLLIDLREDGAFQELRSIDDPAVAMLVCVPWLFFPDYAPVLTDAEQAELELEASEDAVIFVPVTFDSEERQVSLNLLGPFVVNSRTKRGRQLVLTGTEYPVQARVELPAV